MMDWIPTRLSYDQTGYFPKIITDYLEGADGLSAFYAHPVSPEGILASIAARKEFATHRQVLVAALQRQYTKVVPVPSVERNIESLLKEEVFTVCTAHQPTLFAGPLYFIYKILHTIRLAAELRRQHPQFGFVPVFYMGSEDADLDELGHVWLDSEKLVWDTWQKGAVGRMHTQGLNSLIERIEGEFSVQPHGKELCDMLKDAYLDSPDIQTATFRLIHRLFGEYGLVVLIADEPDLKRLMIPVFEEELFSQTSSGIVEKTIKELSKHYKVQANPRAINLFYLKDDLRGRIERVGEKFMVHDSSLVFGEEEMREELHRYPERFSPNVILRGVYQETILPNIAFIGGGGETAYWLELKGLFDHFAVPYPMLILRNSFLLIDATGKEKLDKAGLPVADIFRPEEELINEWVRRQSQQQLSLETEIAEAQAIYEKLKGIAASVDPTLVQHVEALQAKALEPLRELEKKLLKAEKRKFKDQQRQINTVQSALFPRNGLQERTDNFMPWYAARGKKFITDLYAHSLTLEQQFVVLEETVKIHAIQPG
jgi:bacillithiol biosynthesis cysteine-adding enzyme BshC